MAEEEKNDDAGESRLNRMWGNLKGFQKASGEDMKGIVTGDFMKKNFFKKNIGFIVMWATMAFLLVLMRYSVEQDMRRMDDLQKELIDVKIEALTRSSELMEISKQSAVTEQVRRKGMNLRESTTPPYKLE